MGEQIVPGVTVGVFNIGGNGHGPLRLVVGRCGEIGYASNWAIVVLKACVFNVSNDKPVSSVEKTSTAQGPV